MISIPYIIYVITRIEELNNSYTSSEFTSFIKILTEYKKKLSSKYKLVSNFLNVVNYSSSNGINTQKAILVFLYIDITNFLDKTNFESLDETSDNLSQPSYRNYILISMVYLLMGLLLPAAQQSRIAYTHSNIQNIIQNIIQK